MPSVPSIGPGITPLTRMPSPPHSMASTRVSMSTPALAAQTCACSAIGSTACGAEMLMTTRAGLAQERVRRAQHVEGAEQVDVDDRLEAVRRHAERRAGKLPAAPETSTSIGAERVMRRP